VQLSSGPVEQQFLKEEIFPYYPICGEVIVCSVALLICFILGIQKGKALRGKAPQTP